MTLPFLFIVRKETQLLSINWAILSYEFTHHISSSEEIKHTKKRLQTAKTLGRNQCVFLISISSFHEDVFLASAIQAVPSLRQVFWSLEGFVRSPRYQFSQWLQDPGKNVFSLNPISLLCCRRRFVNMDHRICTRAWLRNDLLLLSALNTKFISFSWH